VPGTPSPPAGEAPDPERRGEAGSSPALRTRDLVREYGSVRAVDRVTLQLADGEILTLFGPNGAGKTSLLRMLAGSLRPTSGEIWVGGDRLRSGEPARHRRIGVLSHQTFLYGSLTAEENLRFYGRLFDLPDLGSRIEERLALMGLWDRASTPVARLSRGLRQRLALARALLHDPEIVLLDEPYTGLDPHAASLLRGVLEELRDGRRTVLLVTHNLTQGLELADRVGILVRGRLAYLEGASEVPRDDFEARYREVVEEAQEVVPGERGSKVRPRGGAQ